jgi:hypothetical protein
MQEAPYGRCCQSTSRRSSRTSKFALKKAMKLQLTRYQMEQTALALGARLKTLRQWRQKGWPANWLLKLEENFGEPFDIVEIWTEQDHKRWLDGLDRARSQNVADVYQAENERLKAENVELRRRLSNQQVAILNLQQELGEDAVRKIAVDKALALTRQAAVERAQFFVQQLQRDLQRCDMAQAQMAKLFVDRGLGVDEELQTQGCGKPVKGILSAPDSASQSPDSSFCES